MIAIGLYKYAKTTKVLNNCIYPLRFQTFVVSQCPVSGIIEVRGDTHLSGIYPILSIPNILSHHGPVLRP